MLIVVAILGVLAALLLPALQKGIAQAKKTRCSGQLRQIFPAMALYAADNDGAYIQATGSGWFWCTPGSPLAPYLGGTAAMQRIVICPTALIPTTQVPVQFGTNGFPYVVNYTVVVISSSVVPNPAPFRTTSTAHPGSLVMMADAATNGWGAGFGSATLSRLRDAHLDDANILWCDGHVSSQPVATLVSTNVIPLP